MGGCDNYQSVEFKDYQEPWPYLCRLANDHEILFLSQETQILVIKPKDLG